MTTAFPIQDKPLLTHFSVTSPVFVAETGIAHIWRVTDVDGNAAALKIYKDGNMQDEAPGFDFMTAQNGRGGAYIYQRAPSAVLMEWLDGPSLGDLTREGRDDEADHILVDTANRLHQMPATAITTLETLEERFQSLFNARFAANCPPNAVASLQAATHWAEKLISRQEPQRPLHGDFHHENVLGSARGYLAIDAKGVIGDRHYELANAFRNPLGSEALTHRPDVIQQRAAVWAQGFDTTPRKLLEWATAHSALSLAWTYHGTFDVAVANDVGYVDKLLQALNQT